MLDDENLMKDASPRWTEHVPTLRLAIKAVQWNYFSRLYSIEETTKTGDVRRKVVGWKLSPESAAKFPGDDNIPRTLKGIKMEERNVIKIQAESSKLGCKVLSVGIYLFELNMYSIKKEQSSPAQITECIFAVCIYLRQRRPVCFVT